MEISKNGKLEIYSCKEGESVSIDDFVESKDGITKEQFHSILDIASQPIKKEDAPKNNISE